MGDLFVILKYIYIHTFVHYKESKGHASARLLVAELVAAH